MSLERAPRRVTTSSSTTIESPFTAAQRLDGSVEVITTTFWGIAANGVPYYDPDGVDPGEDAWASLDANGTFVLTQLDGGTA